ncbi:MAG: biopolymer transporter ExbD [Phycisphaerales bacterium]
MLRLRRTAPELRIEMTPMIDVIFLLLTFFIYAMILMVRAELLPMKLRQFKAAEPAKPQPAAVVSIALDGSLWLDRDPIDLGTLLPRLQARKLADPATVLYLAVADGESTVDRAPLLQDIWDVLKDAGMDINLVGRPKEHPRTDRSAPAATNGPLANPGSGAGP